jgi:hypothetical protein
LLDQTHVEWRVKVAGWPEGAGLDFLRRLKISREKAVLDLSDDFPSGKVEGYDNPVLQKRAVMTGSPINEALLVVLYNDNNRVELEEVLDIGAS